ncbi:Uncharacterised protein [Escherichia coli]|nr:Uncharacterised protein [Escherichia coli]
MVANINLIKQESYSVVNLEKTTFPNCYQQNYNDEQVKTGWWQY